VALNRYVLTSTVTVAAGTLAAPVAGEPGTGPPDGPGNSSISAGALLWPQTLIAGTPIVLDSASPLYTALSSSLRPYVQGADDVNHAALSN
jgi:hypothetical protein